MEKFEIKVQLIELTDEEMRESIGGSIPEMMIILKIGVQDLIDFCRIVANAF